MKIFKTALLLSGLFFAQSTLASTPTYDPDDKIPAVEKGQKCAWAPHPLTGVNQSFGCAQDQAGAVSNAANAFATALEGACMAAGNKISCSVSVDEIIPSGSAPTTAHYNQSYSYKCKTGWPPKDDVCSTNNPRYRFQNFTIINTPKTWTCPPTEDHLPESENNRRAAYNIGPIEVEGTKYCFRPLEPIDCDALQGMQPSILHDSFITGDAYTTENPPSCITKCATDENGNQRCGDCKVVSKSWGRQAVGNGLTKWWANAGTFTGTACGTDESEVPPPDAPKCWETKNGLTMCIQDPAEKCVTVNGVQQCEAGCGYVNQEFYCKDVDPEPKPDPNENDKPLPPIDDQISDPNKPLQDMVKGDFKDVQKGVESRVGQVVTGVGNLENSVDALGVKLDEINDQLEYSNGTEEAANNLLKGIKDGVEEIGASMGEGDEDGECTPSETQECADPSGGVKSWWTTQYPDGIKTLLDDKKAEFIESEAYEAMTGEFVLPGNAQPDWTICFDVLSNSYGCKSANVPTYIWKFIEACMLFGAGILARRMLIGA